VTHISGFNVRNLFFCRKRLATPQQIASVDALMIESAEFTIMRQLAMRFRGLLMGGSIEKLDAWLHDAQLLDIYAMQRFARAGVGTRKCILCPFRANEWGTYAARIELSFRSGLSASGASGAARFQV